MTENASASTFEGLLSKFAPFRNLEPDRLRWLAERARPFHCTVGQELLRSDRMPEFCFCIVEGRGRLLHDDPGLRRPVTLAYAHPGDLVGWAGRGRATRPPPTKECCVLSMTGMDRQHESRHGFGTTMVQLVCAWDCFA